MTKIGTAHLEVKAVVNEQSVKDVAQAIEEGLGPVVLTSAALLVSAVRLHDALYENAEAVGLLGDDCPTAVLTAYGDVQTALKQLGMTY